MRRILHPKVGLQLGILLVVIGLALNHFLISSTTSHIVNDDIVELQTSGPINVTLVNAATKPDVSTRKSTVPVKFKTTPGRQQTSTIKPPPPAKNQSLILRYQKQFTVDSKKKIQAYLRGHEERCKAETASKKLPENALPYCECLPTTLVGFRNKSMEKAPEMADMIKDNPGVEFGGHWKPSSCTARLRIAIIIPFRDRQEHLLFLLKELHPILQGQQLEYSIHVVEQATPVLFSKSNLMNIGYTYVNKSTPRPDCIIFHDVDMLPEDGRHFYWCAGGASVTHLGAFHDRHAYRIIYGGIFGSVTAFKPHQFEAVNGFSNRYFTWGGEDDDMGIRVRKARLRTVRDAPEVAGYTALRHIRDSGNVRKIGSGRAGRLKLMRNQSLWQVDGLRDLKYNIQEIRQYKLYTLLYVDVLNPDPFSPK